jgi:putative chitinase
MKLSVDEIARACNARRSDALMYTEHLNNAMARFDINNRQRACAFLATVAIESQNLSKVEEGLYYKDAHRLAAIYPRAFRNAAAAEDYVRNAKDLSDLLYQGHHGRGLIQLTWRKNYIAAGEALGFDYAGQPSMLLQPKHAALTAAWFWATNGCNEAADRGDMSDVTRRVNGPTRLHLHERIAQYNANLLWMGA